MDVNARAPFFLIQGAAKIMRREHTPGAIASIISVAMHGGFPRIIAYSASKAALAIVTRSAAYSLRFDRIRVNGLNIGWTDTPAEDIIQRTFHGGGEDWLAEAEAKMPFGRPAEAPRGSPRRGVPVLGRIGHDDRQPGRFRPVPCSACSTTPPTPPPRPRSRPRAATRHLATRGSAGLAVTRAALARSQFAVSARPATVVLLNTKDTKDTKSTKSTKRGPVRLHRASIRPSWPS